MTLKELMEKAYWKGVRDGKHEATYMGQSSGAASFQLWWHNFGGKQMHNRFAMEWDRDIPTPLET